MEQIQNFLSPTDLHLLGNFIDSKSHLLVQRCNDFVFLLNLHLVFLPPKSHCFQLSFEILINENVTSQLILFKSPHIKRIKNRTFKKTTIKLNISTTSDWLQIEWQKYLLHIDSAIYKVASAEQAFPSLFLHILQLLCWLSPNEQMEYECLIFL